MSVPSGRVPRSLRVPDLFGWLLSPWGELFSSLLAGGLLLVGLVAGLAGTPEVSAPSYWTALGIGMVHALRAAWSTLREWKFNIDVLMVVGAGLAAVINSPGEGALLLFLFVLAGALEELAMQRTTRAVEALHKLMPTKALRLNPDAGADVFESVAPESLVVGDVVKIPPGELVPVDAQVMEGEGSINQANLTGESLPRSVRPGDAVYAGTINIGSPIRVRVSRLSRESSLQKILNLVMEAQQQREPVQRIIDRVSQPYALSVLGVSTLVLVVWWLVFHEPFQRAAYTAITLLIVMSPCAVIIATPTATLAGIARAARAGVLFKGGQSIERLARLGGIAFDKTGTLTVGKMRVHGLRPIAWSDENRLLQVAGALEQDSTHPIAVAIREAAAERGLAAVTVASPGFTPGRGVSALVDGTPARLGNLAFTDELIPACLKQAVRDELGKVQRRGEIGTVIAHDQQAGVIVLSDTVRPGAEELVEQLHALGVRPVVMLTGDNRATAQAVAEALKLDRFRAEMLPGDKVDAVQELKREVRARSARAGAGVIGDGVNDAPALAAADVSIAIGSIGSDAALESADIVLLADDLRMVPWAVGLARATRRKILFNLTFALAAILIMAIATLVGSRMGVDVPLWMGVLGHEGGTLLVVGNSLLLLAYSSPRVSTDVSHHPPVE